MKTDFNYGRYLASREWAVLKAQVRRRSGGNCERCRLSPAKETHHLTYERLGRERLEDLQDVCRGCHAFVSGKTDFDPLNLPVFADEFLECERLEHDAQPSLTGQILAEGLAATTAEALVLWNAKIQQMIVGMADNPHLAMRLAQIKLRVNQEFHSKRRAS